MDPAQKILLIALVCLALAGAPAGLSSIRLITLLGMRSSVINRQSWASRSKKPLKAQCAQTLSRL
jgi:hypothetical protein